MKLTLWQTKNWFMYRRVYVLAILVLTAIVLLYSSQSAIAGSRQQPVLSVRLFAGIVTDASAFERRGILRMAYAQQTKRSRPGDYMEVQFVVPATTNASVNSLLELEKQTFHDILHFDVAEADHSRQLMYRYLRRLGAFVAPTDRKKPDFNYGLTAGADAYVDLLYLADTLRAMRPAKRVFLEPGSGLMEHAFVFSWDMLGLISKFRAPKHEQEGSAAHLLATWLKEIETYRHVACHSALFTSSAEDWRQAYDAGGFVFALGLRDLLDMSTAITYMADNPNSWRADMPAQRDPDEFIAMPTQTSFPFVETVI